MFRVYITGKDNLPYSFDYNDMGEALKATQDFRKDGYEFVSLCSENPNCTSLSGVDSVKSGILPNGEKYDYVKRRINMPR
jgi:hypothetical protein